MSCYTSLALLSDQAATMEGSMALETTVLQIRLLTWRSTLDTPDTSP